MGLCESKEEKLCRDISREIEKQLSRSASKAQQPIKMLLLGPGESGKSTVVRQIRILHANGFSEDEINDRRFIVYSNAVRGMFEIVKAMFDMEALKFTDPQLQEDAQNVIYHVESGLEFGPIPDKIRNAIQRLWNEDKIRNNYDANCTKCHMNENAKYFFEQIERISAQDYRPSNQDILQTRMPTTGIVKMGFRIRGMDFTIIDVGGQRTQRRKWIHFFDDTDLIIFIAAINEYDQKLREDDRMNRLLESIALFDNISNCVCLQSASIILFLNKKDLFRQKIAKVPLNRLFPSYQDGPDYQKAVAFLRTKFHQVYRRDQQKLYSHVTCATDTKQLDKVFNAVLDTITQENMRDSAI